MDMENEERLFSLEQNPRQQRSIRILLEHDFFLEKILNNLIEDSIPECRRVCKRWCKVCGELPIKTTKALPLNLIPALARSFPNIETLHVSGRKTSRDEQNEEIFSCLKSLTGLRSFSLGMFTTNQRDDWISEMLCSLSWLSSLDLRFILKGYRFKTSNNYEPPIRLMTNLTSLALRYNSTQNVMNQKPFDDLCKIQKLAVSTHVLWNDEGRLMFPFLTQLTYLKIRRETHDQIIQGDLLKAIRFTYSTLDFVFRH